MNVNINSSNIREATIGIPYNIAPKGSLDERIQEARFQISQLWRDVFDNSNNPLNLPPLPNLDARIRPIECFFTTILEAKESAKSGEEILAIEQSLQSIRETIHQAAVEIRDARLAQVQAWTNNREAAFQAETAAFQAQQHEAFAAAQQHAAAAEANWQAHQAELAAFRATWRGRLLSCIDWAFNNFPLGSAFIIGTTIPGACMSLAYFCPRVTCIALGVAAFPLAIWHFHGEIPLWMRIAGCVFYLAAGIFLIYVGVTFPF